MSTRALRSWSLGEEIAHSVSHGVGVALAIGGLAVLVSFAALRADAWYVTSCAVFGATLVLLYTASTLYHSIPQPRAKRVLRILDHSAIYLAIAGSYTPLTLGPLRGPWGWTLFGVVWSGAVGGVVLTSLALDRTRVLGLVLYAIMGWCLLVAFGPLLRSVPAGGVALLVAGGLAYSLGVVFYLWKSLRFHHFVWHLMVLLGSTLHVLAVLLFVIPRPR